MFSLWELNPRWEQPFYIEGKTLVLRMKGSPEVPIKFLEPGRHGWER